MIVASNRVPGQLMPVGAHWWCNGGDSLNALQQPATSGLGGPLAVSGLGMTTSDSFALVGFLVNAGMGYLVGKAIGRGKKTEGRDALIGAAAGGVFGIFGVGVQAAIALGGIDRAKALHKKHSKKRRAA